MNEIFNRWLRNPKNQNERLAVNQQKFEILSQVAEQLAPDVAKFDRVKLIITEYANSFTLALVDKNNIYLKFFCISAETNDMSTKVVLDDYKSKIVGFDDPSKLLAQIRKFMQSREFLKWMRV